MLQTDNCFVEEQDAGIVMIVCLLKRNGYEGCFITSR